MKRLIWLLLLLPTAVLAQTQPYTSWANSYVTWNSGLAASFYSVLQNNGVAVPQEPTLNFIPGSNITFTFADNPGTGVTSLTIASSGSAGALLSATDAVNTAPVRGGIVVANSTPKWAQVALGGNGTILASNGTDPSWTAEAVTAPITNTTGNIGISITTTNDGGAVVKQAATPGTQQGSGGNANINTNGTWIEELDALAATSTNGITLQNTTAATSGTPQQVSPNANLCGTGWNGAASETDCYRLQMFPNSGSSGSTFRVLSSVAGGANTAPLTLTNAGQLTILNGITAANSIAISGATSLVNFTSNIAGGGGVQMAFQNSGASQFTGNRLITGTCSGATTCATTTNIPANAVVLSVAVRITTAVTGSTTYELGTTLNPTAFCTGITTVAINSTYVCGGGSTNATGLQNTSAAALVATSTVGGNFTAGVFEFEITYILVTPPTS